MVKTSDFDSEIACSNQTGVTYLMWKMPISIIGGASGSEPEGCGFKSYIGNKKCSYSLIGKAFEYESES